MKKLPLASTILALIVVGWISTTWYSGKKIETGSQAFVEKLSQELAKRYPSAASGDKVEDINIALDSYNRGIFTSHANYTVSIKNKFLSETPIQFKLDNTIEHGPLPLSSLKKLNLKPKFATVYTEASIKDIKTHSITDFNYDDHYNAKIDFSAIKNNTVDIKPATAELSGSIKKGDIVKLKIDIPEVSIASGNSHYNFKDISSSYNRAMINDQINTEQAILSIQKFSLADLELYGIAVKTEGTLEKNLYQGDFSYKTDSVKLNNKEIGSLALNVNVKNFDSLTLGKIEKELIELVLSDKARLNTKLSSIFKKEDLLALTKNKPEITLGPIELKNQLGSNTYRLAIVLQPINAEKLTEISQEQETNSKNPATSLSSVEKVVLSFFSKLESSLILSLPTSKAFFVNFYAAQGIHDETAEELASAGIDRLQTLAQQSPFLLVTDQQISSSINYAAGKVEINTHKMSLKAFIEQYLKKQPLTD